MLNQTSPTHWIYYFFDEDMGYTEWRYLDNDGTYISVESGATNREGIPTPYELTINPSTSDYSDTNC